MYRLLAGWRRGGARDGAGEEPREVEPREERSPEEIFRARIAEGRYGEALRMAGERAELNADEVYKARWGWSDLGRVAIQENLAKVQDRKWVVTECRTRICPTHEGMEAVILYGLVETERYRRGEEEDGGDGDTWWFRYERLRLLQRKDRLETFLGMHNGRYFPKEYAYFCSASLQRVACEYAEGGRIGALDVLFKRHRYSLAPSVLTILDSLPETLPPHSYSNLLPQVAAPQAFLARGDCDWVESKKTVARLNTVRDTLGHSMVGDVNLLESTEHMIKLAQGLVWPSESEIVEWYKNRARTIDKISGQLENSLSLLDWGQRKGVKDLDSLFEEISDLIKVVLVSEKSEDSTLVFDLETWESLSEYQKFQVMLQGVQADSIVDKLREQALPFLYRHHHRSSSALSPVNEPSTSVSTILATWLRDTAQQNKLELCAAVFEDASSGAHGNGLFESESEMIGVAVDCIYLCTAVDQWPLMKSILAKFGHSLDSPSKGPGGTHFQDSPRRGGLRKGLVSRFRMSSKPVSDMETDGGNLKAGSSFSDPRLQQAEARVEASELLSRYHVEQPMKFLTDCEGHNDKEDSVKKLIGSLLWNFSRRQPPRSDSEWMVLWRDLCTLQEKAFPFLEKEYFLEEFCRGLLQAGKYSLAKNYLAGTGSMSLPPGNAESVVLETAREFFYSAPSLDSSAIEMARNCLALLSRNLAVTAEEEIIEAVTVKLPMLGVSLLPLEFRQVEDKMDVVRMALSARSDAYLNLPEIMEVAMLLGLKSPSDIARVEAAIAREAAGAGDFALAQDLCLGLVKKNHGEIWDLCAALARGSQIEGVDSTARTQLLGFALSYCDEESIEQLLAEWKDANMVQACERLGLSTTAATDKEGMSTTLTSGQHKIGHEEGDFHEALSTVIVSDEHSPDTPRTEPRKYAIFARHQLPLLLELSSNDNSRGTDSNDVISHELARECSKPSAIAVSLLIHGIANYGLVWSDHLIVNLAQEAIRSLSNHSDKVGCGYLMNLKDAHMGAEVLEQEVSRRDEYEDSVKILHIAQLYAAVQDASASSIVPSERREILLSSLSSLKGSDKEGSESSRWAHRRVRTEEKLRELGQVRTLERMIPGADIARFFRGDHEYITDKILELVGPNAKKTNFTDVLALAEQYRVDRWQVFMRQLESLFRSEMVTEDDVTIFWQQYEQELLERPQAVLDVLIPNVYTDLDGMNKYRLHQYFHVLADCASALENEGEYEGQRYSSYWRAVARESLEASKTAEHLDFKRIVGLESVEHSQAMQEVALQVDLSNVAQLATIINHLHDFAGDGQFPTSNDVYMALVEKVLGSTTLDESEIEGASFKQVEAFEILLRRYNDCRVCIDHLAVQDLLRVVDIILQRSVSLWNDVYTEDSEQAVAFMLRLWTRAFGDAERSLRSKLQAYEGDASWQQMKAAYASCRTLLHLVDQNIVSGRQSWDVGNGVLKEAQSPFLAGNLLSLISHPSAEFTGIKPLDACMKFLMQMVSAGCSLRAVLVVMDSLVADDQESATKGTEQEVGQALDVKLGTLCQNFQQYIVKIYSLALDSALETCEPALLNKDGSGDMDILLGLLTSLKSLQDGIDSEEQHTSWLSLLSETRQLVWQRLSGYAHNLQVPTRMRISVLELQEAFRMRELIGRDGHPITWSDWDSSSIEQVGGTRATDMFQSQNSLVALKSTELVRPLWPDKQITSEELATVDAATTLFTSLLADASTDEQFLALSSLLKEWNSVFEAESTEESPEVDDGSEWGEGWEECDDDVKIHALHLCWKAFLQKLMLDGRIKDTLQVLDGVLAHPSPSILTEAEAGELLSSVKSHDILSALKVSLLLPYHSLQLAMLGLLEDELSASSQMDMVDYFQGGFHPANASRKTVPLSIVDEELVGLLLSAGVLSTVAGNSRFPRLFAAVCRPLGLLAGQLQNHQLEELQGSSVLVQDNHLYLMAFPLFVAELTCARLYSVAGALVLQFMRVPPSLAVWSAAHTALKRYLEALSEFDTGAERYVANARRSLYMPFTMQRLADRMKEAPRTGLSVLAKDMKPLESAGP
ncbi:hypothetical protein M758_7G052400 [Ceratodon purpureus]|nr:hypothetical protein M758_7G052400 [Ceratodon purpureus]KAG0610272.1 hypothetical protein M758_7G052400 [Ceratodon purpureus]